MADKYKKLKRQVSTDGGFTWSDLIPYEYKAGELIQRDSPDCNNVEWRTVSGYICEENTTEMTQWVADTGYVCVGFDKMNKEKEQVSYNSGISWADTGNTRAGSTLIEQNSTDCGYTPDYSTEYLTTEALGDGYITLRKGGSGSNSKEPITNIQYSKNDGSWTSYTYNTYITVVNGDKIRWKGTIKDGNSNDYYSSFGGTAHYKAYGNPLSLLNNDSFVNYPNYIYNYAYYRLFYGNSQLEDISDLALPATTLANYCYYAMFLGCTSLTTTMALPATTLAENCYEYIFTNCTSLTTAPALPATTLVNHCYEAMFSGCTSLTTAPALPATTLARYAYQEMFYGCTSLTTAPELPATTLALDCYEDMFNGCTSLTTAPALPATTLAYGCYNNMFNGCAGLTTAPALPATTLANYCYHSMFRECISLITAPTLPATTLTNFCYAYMFDGCTSLNSVTCCATDISATDCTLAWLNNVAVTGTFNKDANTTWPTGISGIPSGWTTDTCGCEPYEEQYLTITSLQDNNEIKWIATNSDGQKTVNVSTDNGQTWTAKTSSTDTGTTLATLNTGDKLLLKGSNMKYKNFNGELTYFSTTKNFNVSGNIMSLIGGDNFANITSFTNDNVWVFGQLFDGCTHLVDASNLILPATTLIRNCYQEMFRGCTSLISAPVLPATTMVNYCYNSMFEGCTSLTTAPSLPATTLAESCYGNMFCDCTSLTTPPALPATTLAEACYTSMFIRCTSLTTAPDLPARTLTRHCYYYMFNGCSSLNSVKCLATSKSATMATFGWLSGVSSTGTFTKAAGTTWSTTDISGVPSGWTIVNAT